MALIQKLPNGEGWVGVATGKYYRAPRECEFSAQKQEEAFVQTMPLDVPQTAEAGSAEEALYRTQIAALDRVEQALLKDTSVAYRAFCAAHPEYKGGSDWNANRLCEYMRVKHGARVVDWGDARVPLATTQSLWEEAYQHCLAENYLDLDLDAQRRAENQAIASEALMKRQNQPLEDELYNMDFEDFKKLAGINDSALSTPGTTRYR